MRKEKVSVSVSRDHSTHLIPKIIPELRRNIIKQGMPNLEDPSHTLKINKVVDLSFCVCVRDVSKKFS